VEPRSRTMSSHAIPPAAPGLAAPSPGPRTQPAHASPPSPPRARTERRARWLLFAALVACGWWAWPFGASPTPLSRELVGAAFVFVGALVLATVLHGATRAWEPGGRLALARAAAWAWTQWRRAGAQRPAATAASGLGLGERVALLAGLGLATLDGLLTALLLRDVFPEAPYAIPLPAAWGPEASEWAFHAAVAAFKVGLELYFGVLDRVGALPPLVRALVLSCASLFDATLAVLRGVVLHELGIDGGAVMVSNVVFVGFGLAVPWVVARTGSTLAVALDPWLRRDGLWSWPWRAARGLLLAAALLLALPLGLLGVVAIGLLAVWGFVDELCGLLLGHAPDPEHEGVHRWAAAVAGDDGESLADGASEAAVAGPAERGPRGLGEGGPGRLGEVLP